MGIFPVILLLSAYSRTTATPTAAPTTAEPTSAPTLACVGTTFTECTTTDHADTSECGWNPDLSDCQSCSHYQVATDCDATWQCRWEGHHCAYHTNPPTTETTVAPTDTPTDSPTDQPTLSPTDYCNDDMNTSVACHAVVGCVFIGESCYHCGSISHVYTCVTGGHCEWSEGACVSPPSWAPTTAPTVHPTQYAPTHAPSHSPTALPTTATPTTRAPSTQYPTAHPTTASPTFSPTRAPTTHPTSGPTPAPDDETVDVYFTYMWYYLSSSSVSNVTSDFKELDTTHLATTADVHVHKPLVDFDAKMYAACREDVTCNHTEMPIPSIASMFHRDPVADNTWTRTAGKLQYSNISDNILAAAAEHNPVLDSYQFEAAIMFTSTTSTGSLFLIFWITNYANGTRMDYYHRNLANAQLDAGLNAAHTASRSRRFMHAYDKEVLKMTVHHWNGTKYSDYEPYPIDTDGSISRHIHTSSVRPKDMDKTTVPPIVVEEPGDDVDVLVIVFAVIGSVFLVICIIALILYSRRSKGFWQKYHPVKSAS